ESNCWYTNVNGTDYYLGTYSTFNTVSASKTSYINAENTGVEQFPLELVAKDEIGGGDEGGEGGEVTPPEGGEGETHEHSGYAEDYKCDECSAVVEPEADTTLTLAQAIKLADALGAGNYSTNKYYLTCEIVNVYQTMYGNANVTDADGTDYVIYGLYMGDTRYDALTYKPVTGDELTVYGQVGSYSKDGSTVSSYQMKDAQIDDIVAHEHDYQAVVTEPTCTAEGYTTHTCSICADTYKDSEVAALGHTTENGTCENCGKVIGGEVSHDPITASKTIADLIVSEGWTNTTTKQSFNLDDVVSVKVNGGSNTGKAYEGNHIRIYATDTPAGTLTISVAEGYELVSVKVSTVTGGTYAFLYVDGTSTDICNTTTAVSGSSVVLNSVKNGSNGKQVRVTAIEVVYKAV
ncbi:MAG: hypothetical protein IJD77_08420, partial [Clostridia bacterium]|nr:hypothetical protein [Clostridia bacterium]